jgi:hypothetical protein
MAGATRLELATSGVTGRRSNQTELRPRILALRFYFYWQEPEQAIFPLNQAGRANQAELRPKIVLKFCTPPPK